ATERQLVAASSPEAKEIEIHTITLHNGVAHMTPIRTLALPAGGVVSLKPGGYHLMLHKPRHPLKEGDTVAIELRFDTGAPLTAQFPVRRAQGTMTHHR
ncbi:MAG: copper chaperone PCu(A)C, partial [Gammaproteobacteria bacterium]|nr:copper chaperone PCu(A)C [Gammaproteobacteria bacterium]